MNRYQTFSQRFWALIVDGLILVPFALLDQWVFAGGPEVLVIIWLVITYSFPWCYVAILHGLYGQTLGKMATGVKVIDISETAPITMKQAFLREIGTIVLNMANLGYALYEELNGITRDSSEWTPGIKVLVGAMFVWVVAETVTCLYNRKRRAIHDFIAGTVVVRTDQQA